MLILVLIFEMYIGGIIVICPFETYPYRCPFCSSRNKNNTQNIAYNLYRESITSSTQEIKSENDKIKEYLRIPILHSNINYQILETINTNLKNDILEFKSQMESAADDNAELSEKQGKKNIPFEISNIYSITYDKNDILSLSLIYQENVNNQNSFIRTSYNYDLNTGKPLSLSDLFKPNTDYINTLNNQVRNILQKNSSAYFKDSIKNFKGIAQDQPFYLDDNTLNIYFSFNEIAPVASEIPIIKIPLSNLDRILKKNW